MKVSVWSMKVHGCNFASKSITYNYEITENQLKKNIVFLHRINIILRIMVVILWKTHNQKPVIRNNSFYRI